MIELPYSPYLILYHDGGKQATLYTKQQMIEYAQACVDEAFRVAASTLKELNTPIPEGPK